MTFNAMTEHYEEITVCGKPALFTSIRIKRDTIPDGLYAYDVRHDDECRGIPCEIAPFVMVNHWGTIILAEPLELPDDGRRYIDEDTDWNYAPLDGEDTANHKPCTSISDFPRCGKRCVHRSFGERHIPNHILFCIKISRFQAISRCKTQS